MRSTIRGGDTLSRIAAQHGTSLQRLLDSSPQYRGDTGAIRVGAVIEIPNGVAPGLAEVAPRRPARAMPAGCRTAVIR